MGGGKQDRVPKRREEEEEEEEEGRRENTERKVLEGLFQKQNGVPRQGEGSPLPVIRSGDPPPRGARHLHRRSVGPGGTRTHQPPGGSVPHT